MGSGNYESQILEAIQILVDNAISKAEYDKTIQCTISRCVDKTIGKYIVKYQDSSFYAYSANTDTTYPGGTSVYVLVPGNDMAKDKSIIGTVDHLGPDYVSIIEGENGYEVVGVNTLNAEGAFGLCSYKTEDIKVLYDRDNEVDLVGLDTFGFESYIKKSGSIICGATFKTGLVAEQKFRGDYGIVFNLDFIDQATGETITKSYIVNVDQMTGNPYSYTVASRQYGIFDVDGANFISVKQIYIFAYNFPNTEADKKDDIFVSKVELSAANALDQEAAATCALTFVTPKGTYFDENDIDSDTRILEAQIRIKGNAIDNDSQQVDYYWFRENNKITTKSEKYNQYGGTGWECLNNYTIVQNGTDTNEAVVQWTKGGYKYITQKADNVARETAYKCVAVYFDGTVLSKTIIIYNYSSNYEIEIKSDSGVAFNYDLGKPTLTCYINGKEEVSDNYTYVWSVTNSSNQLSVLEETISKNDEYNNAIASRDAIMAKVEAEQLITAADQEKLELYTQIIDQYEYIMRIENNKIHKLAISSITNFSTYKCSVYKSGVFIGTASLIITNTQESEGAYTLVIENGNQVFKYNENGVSPANGSVKHPITIMPLGFTLYDDKGQKVNHNVIKDIEWKVSTKDTLIDVSNAHGSGVDNADATTSYYNTPELNFRIRETFHASYDKNDVQLIIKYKDKVISAKTNLTFVKEGEVGTNGTDFVCKIVPNEIEGTIAPIYPTLTYNNYTKQYELNYSPKAANKWFKVQLWHNGEKIFEGTETGNSIEGESAKVQWSILQNTYDKTIKDETNFTIDAKTGAIAFDTYDYLNPANIVKAVITYNNVDYYATLPIATVRVKNSDYEIQLLDNSGFREVMYTADGQTPAYDNQPFEIEVFQMIDGIKNDISHFSTSEFAVDYDWEVVGQVYYSQWQSETNLVKTKYGRDSLLRNQESFKPIDICNAYCVSNAIVCTITRETDEIATVHIPVHLYINRYGNAALNGWDGNSISLDEEGGTILAPQVGAGSKNDDNTFTGVFMGSVKEAGAEKEEHGLFGYNAGQRTISLNSEDGSARFGKAGAGQIVIDPTQNTAQLKSGDYIPAEYNSEGKLVKAGSGMLIDLTEPKIEFGSGKFSVDKDGNVVADSFATREQVEDLEHSISYFTIDMNTNSILISADANNKPLESKSYTISFYGKFKGKEITNFTEELVSDNIYGIATSFGNNNITFTVDSTKAIANAVNEYTIRLKYTDLSNLNDIQTYTVEKKISVALAIQGKDGYQGSDGKSAYQIWLDAGNTGSEEEYLASLKGKDGQDGQPGKDGKDGETGKSAYQLWLEAGNTGTEAEYLASLKGEDGAQGPTGPQGPQGDPGKDGEDGKDGKIFYTWIKYSNGDQSSMSDDPTNKTHIGIAYNKETQVESNSYNDYTWSLIKGTDGEDGYTPVKGKDYFDGEDGAPGAAGKGISAIKTQYFLHTSDTSAPSNTASWQDTQPTWVSGKYIWIRDYIIWTEGNPTTTTPTLADALNKANQTAADAKNAVSKIETEYCISISSVSLTGTETWSTNMPQKAEDEYIWSRQKMYFIDTQKTPEYSKPICITGDEEQQGNGFIYIKGTQTGPTSAWTGSITELTSLAAGVQIIYYLPYASNAENVTLELALADNKTTGPIACYYNENLRLGDQYAAGTTIGLLYNNSKWFVTGAPETKDLIKSSSLEYCLSNDTDTDNPPTEGWFSGLAISETEESQYLWSRTVNETYGGDFIYTNYSCMIYSQRELVNQYTEYILTETSNIKPNNNTTYKDNQGVEKTWSKDKPIENVSDYPELWTRTISIYKYSNGQEFAEDSNYTKDTSWGKLFSLTKELDTSVDSILAAISEGVVKIENGNILIGDNATSPEHVIIMNHNGIAFFDNSHNTDTWPSETEIEGATSTWSIDGNLNMQGITVKNLQATSIANQNLVLGNGDTSAGSNVVGDLDIYDAKGKLMFETIVDSTGNYIEGFKFYKYIQNGTEFTPNGYVYISKNNGFQEFDSSNRMLFGNRKGEWSSLISQTEQQIISKTENDTTFGAQIVPMRVAANESEDGLAHIGIAFLKL